MTKVNVFAKSLSTNPTKITSGEQFVEVELELKDFSDLFDSVEPADVVANYQNEKNHNDLLDEFSMDELVSYMESKGYTCHD